MSLSGEIEGGRPSRVVPQGFAQFGLKDGIVPDFEILRRELVERRHQSLGHEHPAVRSKMAVLIREQFEVDHRTRSVGPPAEVSNGKSSFAQAV